MISLGGNTYSLISQRHLNTVNRQLSLSLERLATGYKINRASDGPGALLVSENLRSQIRGFDVASSNVQQGLSMLQVADSALQQIITHVQNIRDIAVAASNGTTTADQFAAYEDQLTAELAAINQIATGTEWGSNVLLNGTMATLNIQLGPNSGDTLNIGSAFSNNQTAAGGLAITQTTLAAAADATTLLGQADAALATATGNLATIGGFESRMTNQLNYLSIAKENFSAAEANIRNTDIAAETANVTRLQILQQAAAYSLAQANAFPNIALALLRF